MGRQSSEGSSYRMVQESPRPLAGTPSESGLEAQLAGPYNRHQPGK